MAKEDLPVDRGWAWVVCGAVFIITFLLSATGQMISVTLLDLVGKYDTTITTVSLLFLFQIAATSFSSIFATNFLVPRFGIRHVCVVSAVVGVIASMIFTVSPSIYLCIALYAVKGACNGFIAIPAISILGYYFNKHRSIATSLAMCGICGGSIAYPPFVRHILSIYGLQGTYLVCSAIEAHMIVACLLIRPVTMYRLPPPPPPKSEIPPEIKDTKIYEAKQNGSMELVYDGAEDDFSEKEDDGSYLGRSPDCHERKHLYIKKNGASLIEPSRSPDSKLRAVSFTSDEDNDSTQKESLLISDGSKSDIRNNNQEVSSRDRWAKVREAYRRNRSAGLLSHEETLLYKRRLLKDGQKPSLWSLYSSPSTLGIPEVVETEEEELEHAKTTSRCGWLGRIFDVSLFKVWPFVWMLMASVPCGTNQLMFVFLPTIGVMKGVSKDQSALLLTIMGSIDLISRLAIGAFADRKYVRISSIIGFASVCLGIVSIFTELYTDLKSLLIMSVFLGFFVGIRMSLGTVMFIEIVGLEKMSKAFSVYAMCLTLSGAIHSTLLGRMIETLGEDALMYYMGFTFILGGVMVWIVPLVTILQKQCKKTTG